MRHQGTLTACVLLMISCFATAGYDSDYVEDTNLDSLPMLERNFVIDIVKAYRDDDVETGLSRIHPDGLTQVECRNIWIKRFTEMTILSKYAVRVEDGKKAGSLSFSIRHQTGEQDAKRSFMKIKDVVTHNGKLVIFNNCDSTLLMIQKMKEYQQKNP